MANEDIIGKIIKPTGTLEFGERDPITGQRFETFDPKITSESLKPAQSIDFQTAEETPIFPVGGLNPPLQLTETEQKAQTGIEDLQTLTEQLVGESAFRAEQEEGLVSLTATQTDLSSRLKALQNEALAIPLQLQQEATGRGITAGGLRPLQTARLRENAIKALEINSLLEASRGNITTAQDMADRAVAQKFDPIKEEIAAKTANLNLILQSPEFSLEQKNRAQKQFDIQNARLLEAKQEATKQTAINQVAVLAAQKGVDALTLGRIQAAPSEAEATRIAEGAGVFITEEDKAFTLSPGQTRFDTQGNIVASVIKPVGEELDELLSPNELALFNAPAGSTMRDVMGLIPKTELTGVQKFQQEIKLGKEFEKLVGDSRKAVTAVQNIDASLVLAKKARVEGKSINAASQGILVAFQKLLDPGSVVRESEYARSGNGQSLWDSISGRWEKIKGGGAGVTMEELENFVETAGVFLTGYQNTALKHAKRMQVISERQGLDLPSILTQDMIDLLDKGVGGTQVQFNSLQEWVDTRPDNLEQIRSISERDNLDEAETLQLINRLNQRLGFSSVGGDTNTASVVEGIDITDKTIARTDRHNNPTAFTTDIAKQGGLIEGVDYIVGDKFPDSNLTTAALIGDPVEQTIKVIDNIGFFTNSGKQRWTHTALSEREWNKLSDKEKSDVIKKMYQREGNQGLLNIKFA